MKYNIEDKKLEYSDSIWLELKNIPDKKFIFDDLSIISKSKKIVVYWDNYQEFQKKFLNKIDGNFILKNLFFIDKNNKTFWFDEEWNKIEIKNIKFHKNIINSTASKTAEEIKYISWLILSDKLKKILETEVILSDLDDTIIKSKKELDISDKDDIIQVENIIKILNSWKKIYIITWWKKDVILKNLVNPIKKYAKNNNIEVNFDNLILAPVSGAEIYEINKQWNYELISELQDYIFEEQEDQELRKKISDIFKTLFKKEYWTKLKEIIENEIKWEQVENRWKQIAISIFWQKASSETKWKLKKLEKQYNCDIRKDFIELFFEIYPEYKWKIDLKKWGSTTIDIKKIINWIPLDKWLWYKHIIENLWKIDPSKIMWLWDNNNSHWNDYALAQAIEINGGNFINPRNEKEWLYILYLLSKTIEGPKF